MVLESSGASTSKTVSPKVSVIVPARNEERTLERCLRSLVVQTGIPFEVIVVDDQSTDRTGEIAETFTRAQKCPFLALNQDLCGVTVLSPGGPPEGWTGKANACWSGAKAARGEWLLFTDADTEHLPDSLAAAIREARDHGAGLLSYSPEQVLNGLAQKALMPVIFGELATVYKPAEVSDPQSPVAAANGQYLLIRRDVYDSIGGHAEVAGSLLEDVGLARMVKQCGVGLRFRLGRGMVRAHMYSGWADMREGWTKNLALLFPQAKTLAAKRGVEFLVIVAAVLSAMILAIFAAWVAAAVCLAVGVLMLGNALVRLRRAHFSWGVSLLGLVGTPLFSWLLLKSAEAHASKTVLWKGRGYSPGATSEESGESNR